MVVRCKNDMMDKIPRVEVKEVDAMKKESQNQTTVTLLNSEATISMWRLLLKGDGHDKGKVNLGKAERLQVEKSQ